MEQDALVLWKAEGAGGGAWLRSASIVRDLRGLPAVLARLGTLEVRLATTRREIRKAQRLRYKIFYEQGCALPDPAHAAVRRDKCPYDKMCDHLIVVDTAFLDSVGTLKHKVVGTTRLMRSDMAAGQGGFYSATAFELGPLLRRHEGRRLLELGRSCVHASYRSKRVIDLLWQGIGRYAAHHGTDALIGCSSLMGTTAADLAAPLSFAFHYAAAPAPWQVSPLADRVVRMDWLKREAIDPSQALLGLPTLMKAYVRAGGAFASQAAVDWQFGTIDLFTVLPIASAHPRFLAHFGPALGRAV